MPSTRLKRAKLHKMLFLLTCWSNVKAGNKNDPCGWDYVSKTAAELAAGHFYSRLNLINKASDICFDSALVPTWHHVDKTFIYGKGTGIQDISIYPDIFTKNEPLPTKAPEANGRYPMAFVTQTLRHNDFL